MSELLGHQLVINLYGNATVLFCDKVVFYLIQKLFKVPFQRLSVSNLSLPQLCSSDD